MPLQIKLAIFNLENTTSVTVLSAIVGEVENQNPDFVLFTNVWMEPYFPKSLIKTLKSKGWVTDSYSQLGDRNSLKTREILFRKKSIILDGKVIDTHFDQTQYGFRTFCYLIPTDQRDPPTRKVIIKTFTLDEDVEVFRRKSQLTHLLEGDVNLQVPEIVLSDFRVPDWEDYPTHRGWVDLYEVEGSSSEDVNYESSRRDRIWVRENTALVKSLSSAEFPGLEEKLAGDKKMTIGVLEFRE